MNTAAEKGARNCSYVTFFHPCFQAQESPPNPERFKSLAEAAREREERAERQVELAAKQVEALGAVAAQLQQLNRRMESVDQRLDQSHRSSGRSFGWTITVGALTLVATIVGIVVAVVLSHG